MIPLSVKSSFEPLQVVALDGDHIKPTWGCLSQFQQIVTRSKHNAPLFDKGDAGQSPAMLGVAAFSYLDKDQGAIALPHDQIYFATTPPGRSIIALHQLQPLGL